MENLISINPEIMMGKPCVAGTRITVELLQSYKNEDSHLFYIRELYPSLAKLTDKELEYILSYKL